MQVPAPKGRTPDWLLGALMIISGQFKKRRPQELTQGRKTLPIGS